MTEELRVVISAEIGQFKSSMKEGMAAVKDMAKASGDANKSFMDGFKKAGTAVTNAAKGIAVGIGAGVTALVALSAATEEYRANQAKLTTAFESAGASAATATQTYNDLYRVLGDDGQATEAANHLAKLTTNQEDLAEWTEICQGVYATFGESLPIEGLTEAANETAKTGTVTGNLADALNWAGISEDAFNEKLAACNSEAEREKLIRETLSGVYDEAAATYEKNAAGILAQNEAQAKLNESLAAVGAAMAPVNTMLMNFGATILASITPYIESFAATYLPKIAAVLQTIANVIGVIFTWIMNNWELVSNIAIVIGAIAAAIVVVNTALAAYNAVMAISAALTAAVASPILLVTAAIAAVIAIIILCIKYWDEITAAVSKAVEKIVSVVKGMVDAVVGFFNGIIDFVKSNWQGLLLLIVNPFAGAFKLAYDNCEAFRNTVNTVFNAIKTTISNIVNGIKNTITSVFNSIKTTMTNTITAAKNTVLGIFDSIKSGISNAINGAKDIVGKAIDAIKGFFKFEWSLPKLKLPHISIKGSFSLMPPSVPKFSIDWYAQGGVFDSPTLFNYAGGLGGLGEDGAEAVVPLEKNTQWLDRIAERLSGGGRPIILQVDGKTFGQISIDSINELTRQTGKLGLRLT